jgi:hypothetical protein
VSQIRNIGVAEGNKPVTDNDWETIIGAGEDKIEKWIEEQMRYRSCTIVLIGEETANRKWINHEIVESWNKGMGIVGICIHGLKNSNNHLSNKGKNPFDCIKFEKNGEPLSSVVKCYNPAGTNSKERYNWIAENLEEAVEEAIAIRSNWI